MREDEIEDVGMIRKISAAFARTVGAM